MARRSGDGSTLLYTSGTTGQPKGVLFRHHSTGAAAHHFIELLGIGADDTILAVTPLFHGNAWGAACTALRGGRDVRLSEDVSRRASSGRWCTSHAPRCSTRSAPSWRFCWRRSRSELERDNPLRVILGLGSAPIRDRVIERFGVADVAECFGSTDAGVVTMTPLGAAPRKGSAGPAVPGVDAAHRRRRRQGAAGARGRARSSSTRRTAWPSTSAIPSRRREALRDGWFHSGDLGYLDEDGWLYFVDRKRDVIRRGGENMSSVLIEKTLCEHPAVAEAAVIGVPDPVLGQEVKAFIVAKTPVTVDELRAFASERLAKFQVPRLWEFRESLPKTPTQRVEKYKLRDQASDKPLLG